MARQSSNRRDFLRAAGAMALTAAAAPGVHARGEETIKIGLIGCGGRGGGAVRDCLAADRAVRVHAIGDVFADAADAVAKNLASPRYAQRVDLTDRVFTGLDAYQKVIDSGVDVVLLATPPGFRPLHLEAAVKAGKHVFTEKPVAVDAPGIRKVLEVAEEAKRKQLSIAAGTQRRHQKSYLEVFKFIQDGGLGEVLGGRCSWNNSSIWFYDRKKVEERFQRTVSDVEYQLGNWYHFLWLCGDHIVEQHVHNIDVIQWYSGRKPVRAVGMGGRMGNHSARPNGSPKDVGNIFDHFAIEFEFEPGFRVSSYCRHYPGMGDVSEMIVGTKGMIRTGDKQFYQFIEPNGTKRELHYAGDEERARDPNPYVQEHVNLIRSIRNGTPLNELEAVAESTLAAIMGRTAAYTGEVISWDKALRSQQNTMPENLTLDMELPEIPTPRPGVTKFF